MQQRLQKTVSQGNKLRYSFMVFVLSALKKILIAWVVRNYSYACSQFFFQHDKNCWDFSNVTFTAGFVASILQPGV